MLSTTVLLLPMITVLLSPVPLLIVTVVFAVCSTTVGAGSCGVCLCGAGLRGAGFCGVSLRGAGLRGVCLHGHGFFFASQSARRFCAASKESVKARFFSVTTLKESVKI